MNLPEYADCPGQLVSPGVAPVWVVIDASSEGSMILSPAQILVRRAESVIRHNDQWIAIGWNGQDFYDMECIPRFYSKRKSAEAYAESVRAKRGRRMPIRCTMPSMNVVEAWKTADGRFMAREEVLLFDSSRGVYFIRRDVIESGLGNPPKDFIDPRVEKIEDTWCWVGDYKP